ncbi:D-hexose-6-phosphate mutarotase [uncultured Draconibacterium sp.]|uniref:D-hexose-6-phosphate mutarotase n=1 Tax=uncultured Draconibacterium sp. TaxID=1573823 RepID=UPI0025DF1008|nr:D-hexose-6-phosphate mutarotase [uncultured Draconibacterium sp.]
MNIDDLNENFGVEGEVCFMELEGDLPFITVTNKYAEADICLYGAQITGFRPAGTTDVLWMSPYSVFEVGKAIRGGIPVCFPWFGPHAENADFPQHGFARTSMWQVLEVKTLEKGETSVALQLNNSAQTQKFWPHEFAAKMIFIIGKSLSVTLEVSNTSTHEFSYTAALHSYFNLSGVENISIEGLENTSYENQLDGKRYTQGEKLLGISEAITRHYFNTTADCVITDPYFNRNIRIGKEGSKCSTVWNPWAATCKQMSDMPNNAYETFVCLETVNNINDKIVLAPGQSHGTTAIISIE